MEWNGMEWNGMEWNGIGSVANGMESGASRMEWNRERREWNGIGSVANGMEWNGMESGAYPGITPHLPT